MVKNNIQYEILPGYLNENMNSTGATSLVIGLTSKMASLSAHV